MAENVDITLLTKICQDTLAETKAMRHDLANVQMLAVKTVDVLTKMEERNAARFNAIEARFGGVDARFAAIEARFTSVDNRFVSIDTRLRSIDLRIDSLKDELQLTIKRELIGALTSFEAKMIGLIEHRLARSD